MPPNLDFSPHNSLSTLVGHSSIELLLDDFARWRFPPYILEKVPCNPLHVQCGPNVQSTPCPMWTQRAIHSMSNVGPTCNPPNHTPSLSRAHSLPGDPTRLGAPKSPDTTTFLAQWLGPPKSYSTRTTPHSRHTHTLSRANCVRLH